MMDTIIYDIWFADIEKEEEKTALKALDEIPETWLGNFFEEGSPFKIEDGPKLRHTDAMEIVILRAIDIGMVKTRLRTAIDNHKPKYDAEHRSVSDFFPSPRLTDVTLYGSTKAEYP